jgi:hypothetical protein
MFALESFIGFPASSHEDRSRCFYENTIKKLALFDATPVHEQTTTKSFTI